jgi:hypothetical protein
MYSKRPPSSFIIKQIDRAIEEAPAEHGVIVYALLTAENHCKIGFTRRETSKRRGELALGNAFHGMEVIFHVPGSELLERLLLARFRYLSVDGREIIYLTDEVKDYFQALTEKRSAIEMRT